MTRAPEHGSEPLEEVVISIEMLRFLRGVGPLNGLWFGETRDRSFWWRDYLPHEPEPVDLLREALVSAEKVAASSGHRTDDDYWDSFAQALRARLPAAVAAIEGEG